MGKHKITYMAVTRWFDQFKAKNFDLEIQSRGRYPKKVDVALLKVAYLQGWEFATYHVGFGHFYRFSTRKPIVKNDQESK